MTIKEIFQIATNKGASDVHLVVGLPPFIRVNGELSEVEGKKTISKKDMEQLVFSILTSEEGEKLKQMKELDLGFENDDKTRFRINIHFEKGNLGLVARVINEKIPQIDELGLPKIIYGLLNLTQGLILVTGPTGCGKSTSLAAMIDYINANQRHHIVTLEDPIEYVFEPKKSIIIQRQLGSDMVSFAEGLKHALRQDPNVIMVGEMRDLETIATTLTLAETGHLVLATLHTYSAAQTIDRVVDTFPPHQQNQVRMQLSMVLAGVISQRLLAKSEGGRIAAREIMTNTPAISNLIRENKIAQIRTIIETSSKEGMVTLDQDIKRLLDSKVITKEEALRNLNNPEMIEKSKK
jgi:twitching motility protein PilT